MPKVALGVDHGAGRGFPKLVLGPADIGFKRRPFVFDFNAETIDGHEVDEILLRLPHRMVQLGDDIGPADLEGVAQAAAFVGPAQRPLPIFQGLEGGKRVGLVDQAIGLGCRPGHGVAFGQVKPPQGGIRPPVPGPARGVTAKGLLLEVLGVESFHHSSTKVISPKTGS